LEELALKNYTKFEIIARKGKQQKFVHFIMAGVVKNTNEDRFLEAGNMFNYDCILRGRKQNETFIAYSDRVTTMSFKADIFL